MKITDLQIENFGHWHGLRLESLSTGVTLIHGPNEAGKSTLLHFIRAALYGFSPKRHARFVPPLHAGRVGGSISVVAPNGSYDIRRLLPPPGVLADHEQSEISVKSKDGSRKGSQILQSLLAGVDDSTFRNVFAVGLSEIQYLGTLSDTEAAQQLYGLAMGGDRVSLADVTRELENARLRIIGPENSDLEALIDRRMSLRRDIEVAHDDNHRWSALLNERKAIEGELSQLDRQKQGFLGNGNLKQLTSELRQKWQACRKIHRRLVAIGKVPSVSRSHLTKLDEMTEQIRQRRKKWEEIKEQRRQLHQKAAEYKHEYALTSHESEVEVLATQKSRIRPMAGEVRMLEKRIEETEFEFQAEIERTGVKIDLDLHRLPQIDSELINSLSQPARELREARELMEQAEKLTTQHRTEAERLQRQLTSGVAKLGNANLTQLHDRLIAIRAGLKRRMQLDADLEKAKRSIQQVRRESQGWREREVLPWRGLVLLGGVFSIGIAFLIAGWLGSHVGFDQNSRWLFGVFGVALTMLGPGFRFLSEFGARQGLDACEDEIDELEENRRRLKAELEQLINDLPKNPKSLLSQIEDTDQEILEVEQYLPLESERKAAEQQAENALRQKEVAAEQMRDAKNRWRTLITNVGLPDTLTPVQFRKLSEHSTPLSRIHEGWKTLQETLRTKKRELELIDQQVQSLMSVGQLIPEQDELDHQIDLLTKSVRSQRQANEKRESLHKQWQLLGREQEKIATLAKRYQERRIQTMEKLGVADEDELRKLVKRQARAVAIRKERDQLAREIAETMGDETTVKQIVRQLDRNDFIQQLSQLEGQHDDVHNRINQLYKRQGELDESIKSLVSRKDLGSKKVELSEIEQKIQRSVDRWRVYTGTSFMLDRVRRDYESDRQPETLAEASGYLNRLTQGKYTRVWTPFGESALSVDSNAGKAFSVESLSRGTREQVFLSLRMALVANYGRRGAKLPLILDDVFVNFDIERAEAAVAAIKDFADEGHQVLVFTCHDHIRDIFDQMDVDVRELPDARQLANGVTVLPSSGKARKPPKILQAASAEPQVDVLDDGQERFYITADELARLAYNDDFYGDDGTFFPLAAARKHRKTLGD